MHCRPYPRARDGVGSRQCDCSLGTSDKAPAPAAPHCRGAKASRRRYRRLSEYRGGPSALRLCTALHALGYRHATTLVPPPGRSGVLVAARHRLRGHGAVDTRLPEPYRMVSVDFATFRLIGIYMPSLLAKIPYWGALITALSSQSANRTLAMGDFNTCRAYLDEVGAIDRTAHYMDAIEQIGFRDVWRHRYPDRREYSWFSTRRNGFRIDHAFLSPDLAACAGTIRYSHAERIAGSPITHR